MEVESTMPLVKASDRLQTQFYMRNGWVRIVLKDGHGLIRYVARVIQENKTSLFRGVLDL